MFCPSCGADFRDGFTQCSDCDIPLVDALPEASWPTESAPSGLPPGEFLLWFIPLSLVATLTPIILLSKLNPSRIHPLHIVVILVTAAVALGSFWMLVQVIDHEERAKSWIPFSIIPFMFLWYWLVRYRTRPKFVRYQQPNTNRSD